jgi:hypothetical protein
MGMPDDLSGFWEKTDGGSYWPSGARFGVFSLGLIGLNFILRARLTTRPVNSHVRYLYSFATKLS